MNRLFGYIKDTVRKADHVLLLLCVVATAFGCLVISSATNAEGSIRYVLVQILAAVIGISLFFVVSSIDADFFSEHRGWLVGINCFMLLLLIPFGTDNATGNKSWLELPLMPVQIQPAEICKIFYIIVAASAMNARQNRLSSIRSIFFYAVYLAIPVGLNLILSKDAGVSLIFVFIFIGMTFAGGVKLIWFLVAGCGITAAVPILWNNFMREDQRKRFEILWNPTIDPQGIDERYHLVRSLKSLTGGGMLGQGLFNGNRTQVGALPSQHTDFIFSAIGEELGYVGCLLVLVMLFAVVARCIWVGCRSQDYLRRLVCFGAASALVFQICVNVGMCMGVMPVIGLTLPLISYGGSSTVTIYAMLGLVSGVYARPAPQSYERYIRPPM